MIKSDLTYVGLFWAIFAPILGCGVISFVCLMILKSEKDKRRRNYRRPPPRAAIPQAQLQVNQNQNNIIIDAPPPLPVYDIQIQIDEGVTPQINEALGINEEGLKPDGKFCVLRLYKNVKTKKKGEICPICTVEFGQEEEIKQIVICRHVYHKKCLDEWLLKKNQCPYCSIYLNEELLEGGKNYELDSFKDLNQPPTEQEEKVGREFVEPPTQNIVGKPNKETKENQ